MFQMVLSYSCCSFSTLIRNFSLLRAYTLTSLYKPGQKEIFDFTRIYMDMFRSRTTHTKFFFLQYHGTKFLKLGIAFMYLVKYKCVTDINENWGVLINKQWFAVSLVFISSMFESLAPSWEVFHAILFNLIFLCKTHITLNINRTLHHWWDSIFRTPCSRSESNDLRHVSQR